MCVLCSLGSVPLLPQDLIHVILNEIPHDMCKETEEIVPDKDEMLTIMRGLLAKDRLNRIGWSDLEKCLHCGLKVCSHN